MSKRVIVPISKGFEEIEAVTVIDVLRRAGAEVVVAGVDGDTVTGRSGIPMIPDMSLNEALEKGPYDLMVLPGGQPNANTLRDDARIMAGLKETIASDGQVAAICAAPIVLEKAGMLAGQKATSFPSVAGDLQSVKYSEERVVVSGSITTSRAPGTAMEFAFQLVRTLYSDDKAREVNQGVMARL